MQWHSFRCCLSVYLLFCRIPSRVSFEDSLPPVPPPVLRQTPSRQQPLQPPLLSIQSGWIRLVPVSLCARVFSGRNMEGGMNS
ncbi:hypothetical protein QBC32DRAFT_335405 [Pseudoneurospora amorphoporcata]|uniref:Secreted protein n=1 Tax=Pseudoneurospora amorphoporcata TaxID=241081 RepID=A0AAN6P154_9PEZI|nr:hypothetical protein QBC32DRAFT_335405 [Pseudoneurospora amorphoporcata]